MVIDYEHKDRRHIDFVLKWIICSLTRRCPQAKLCKITQCMSFRAITVCPDSVDSEVRVRF